MHYQQKNLAEVVALFQASVQGISSDDYSKEQINAWASPTEIESRMADWQKKLQAHSTLLAKQNGKIIGFIHYRVDGYLDLLFTHPDYQRQSLASKLVSAAEEALRELAVGEMSTNASITARPFFEALGYQIIKKQSVQKKNQLLINFQMKKDLSLK